MLTFVSIDMCYLVDNRCNLVLHTLKMDNLHPFLGYFSWDFQLALKTNILFDKIPSYETIETMFEGVDHG